MGYGKVELCVLFAVLVLRGSGKVQAGVTRRMQDKADESSKSRGPQFGSRGFAIDSSDLEEPDREGSSIMDTLLKNRPFRRFPDDETNGDFPFVNGLRRFVPERVDGLDGEAELGEFPFVDGLRKKKPSPEKVQHQPETSFQKSDEDYPFIDGLRLNPRFVKKFEIVGSEGSQDPTKIKLEYFGGSDDQQNHPSEDEKPSSVGEVLQGAVGSTNDDLDEYPFNAFIKSSGDHPIKKRFAQNSQEDIKDLHQKDSNLQDNGDHTTSEPRYPSVGGSSLKRGVRAASDYDTNEIPSVTGTRQINTQAPSPSGGISNDDMMIYKSSPKRDDGANEPKKSKGTIIFGKREEGDELILDDTFRKRLKFEEGPVKTRVLFPRTNETNTCRITFIQIRNAQRIGDMGGDTCQITEDGIGYTRVKMYITSYDRSLTMYRVFIYGKC